MCWRWISRYRRQKNPLPVIVDQSGPETVEVVTGAEHFSGTLAGSVENGALTASMKQAKMPYETVFRAPLEIENGVATLSWLKNDKGFQLDGRNIDVKAKAVRARWFSLSAAHWR